MKDIIVKAVAKAIVCSASLFASVPCLGIYHEPKMPESLKK